MKFSEGNQPDPKSKRGRPRGSQNKRSQFAGVLTHLALEKLAEAITEGKAWAIQLVLSRTHPALKPVTPVDSLDGRLIELKMREMSEFEQRLQKLENQQTAARIYHEKCATAKTP